MNTAECAYRLLRHAKVSDPAALTRGQAAELMGALSSAVANFFADGPPMKRQTSASVTLDAPRTATISVVTGATEVASGSPFTSAQRGATLYIYGDPAPNEIVSGNGWLNPYQGSAGTKTATIYGDAIPIGTKVIDRLLSDPVLIDPDTGVTHFLARARKEHLANLGKRQEGRPEFYAIQPAGAVRGSTVQYIVRVWPYPTRQMIVRFEAELQPDTFNFTNVAQSVLELPFSEAHMERIVLPLAENELLSSTLLVDLAPNVANEIKSRAGRAVDALRTIPKDHGRPRGRIRTRPGF